VDLSAIATLVLLDALDELNGFQCSFVVSELTLAELNKSLEEGAGQDRELGYLRKEAGRYVFEKQNPEGLSRHNAFVRDIVGKVRSQCAVVGCPELAEVAPDRREPLIKLIGAHAAQSVLLAARPGRALWTDDFVVAMLARNEFGVNRAWTRVAFELRARTGSLRLPPGPMQPDVVSDITAKLIGWRYYFTSPDPSSLVRAASLAQSNPGLWPLKQALALLADETISVRDALTLAASFIVKYANEVTLPEDRDSITVGLLESLSKRKGGLAAINALLGVLPRAFSLNVVRANETDQVIRAWIASKRFQQPH
jgi:hypothetical protein